MSGAQLLCNLLHLGLLFIFSSLLSFSTEVLFSKAKTPEKKQQQGKEGGKKRRFKVVMSDLEKNAYESSLN